jgi:hypothetical protein
MFQDSSLRAGPRAPLPAPNTSAAPPQLVDEAAPDTADFGSGGIPCRARSTANAHSLANAANASLPGDTHHCNTVPAASLARTNSHIPSTNNVGDEDDAGLDRSPGRHHTVLGPRERLLPLGQASEWSGYSTLKRFVDSSAGSATPADPALSLLSLLHELNPPCATTATCLWRTYAAMCAITAITI